MARQLLSDLGAGDILDQVDRYGRTGDFINRTLDAMGTVGSLIRNLSTPFRSSGARVSASREIEAASDLLRAFGHAVLNTSQQLSPEDIERAVNALRGAGYNVQPGAPESPPSIPPAPPRSRRLTEDVDFGRPHQLEGGVSFTTRINRNDALLTGQMIEVESSNVHSIGFRIDEGTAHRERTGTLLVRFLGTDSSGKRSGPGPLYEYSDVPAELFQRFRRASSKGEFVWDELRVRGSVSGHQYAYKLAGITNGYVPRQAGLKRGRVGEYYLQRRFRDESGQLLTSQLPEQLVRGSGRRLQGPGADRLRLQPNRGEPNRGRPSPPNRGR